MIEPVIPPSFVPFLAMFQECFGKRTYVNFVSLLVGWIVRLGRRTVTGLICAANLEGVKHHTTYHRFFRAAKWVPDQLGNVLLQLILRRSSVDVALRAIVDDSLTRSVGNDIAGASIHQDPVRSTKKHKAYHWGHVWVILSIEVPVPLTSRRFALPIMARMYRSEKVCKAQGRVFRTKPELAREMVEELSAMVPGRSIRVVGDNAYTNSHLMKDLPENVQFTGHARMNAVVYGEPDNSKKRPGRRQKKGKRLPSFAECAMNRTGWQDATIKHNNEDIKIRYKIIDGIWYRATGNKLSRFVLVIGWPGSDGPYLLCSTGTELEATDIILDYAARWGIEVTFHEVKQHLGFEDPQNRTEIAVERTAPMALWIYSLVVLWFCSLETSAQEACIPTHAWYKKDSPAFSDMLAALRREIWRANILDPMDLTAKDQINLEPLLREAAYAT